MTVYEMNIFQTLCFMYLCKNGNTPSIFKHIYTLKPINRYTTRSKNTLFKPLCKKNFVKFKLSYCVPHLWNKFIAPNNDLLEAESSGKWSDPGHFFCHFYVPFFYIFLTSKMTNETLKSFLGRSILHYYDKVRRFYF